MTILMKSFVPAPLRSQTHIAEFVIERLDNEFTFSLLIDVEEERQCRALAAGGASTTTRRGPENERTTATARYMRKKKSLRCAAKLCIRSIFVSTA